MDLSAISTTQIVVVIAVAVVLFAAGSRNTGAWKACLDIGGLSFVGGSLWGLYHGFTGKDG